MGSMVWETRERLDQEREVSSTPWGLMGPTR